MADRLRILAYSHDGYGLGHLRRNLRLVTGLTRRRADVEAALLTGASGAETLLSGTGVRCFQLPVVVKVANGTYVPEAALNPEDVLSARKGLIEEAFRCYRPDLVLVDRYPLGLKEELLPALEWLRAEAPHVPVVLGLRDILDEPDTVDVEWRAGGYTEAIRRYYHRVLIYGDPAVFNPLLEYPAAAEIADLAMFTGYLTDDVATGSVAELRSRLARPGQPLAVCTLGGGRDARPVAEAFLAALHLLRGDGWRGCLITGPYMTPEDVDYLVGCADPESTLILPMVSNVPDYLGTADVVVCMGGYNTLCEVLATRAPAIVVPRIRPRREQIMRASLFAGLGLLHQLDPESLSASHLAAEIRLAADGRASDRTSELPLLRLGVERTTDLLESLVGVRVT